MENVPENREVLISQFISEIKAHPHFTPFFAGYSTSSVDMFVKLYACKKALNVIIDRYQYSYKIKYIQCGFIALNPKG